MENVLKITLSEEIGKDGSVLLSLEYEDKKTGLRSEVQYVVPITKDFGIKDFVDSASEVMICNAVDDCFTVREDKRNTRNVYLENPELLN